MSRILITTQKVMIPCGNCERKTVAYRVVLGETTGTPPFGLGTVVNIQEAIKREFIEKKLRVEASKEQLGLVIVDVADTFRCDKCNTELPPGGQSLHQLLDEETTDYHPYRFDGQKLIPET